MAHSKILIVTDAWYPQINGVVRTLDATRRELEKRGHSVTVVGPDLKRWCVMGLPSYPSIKLEFFAGARLKTIMLAMQPDFIHVATEGPLGWTARTLCMRLKKPFTTSYHTQLPDYIAVRVPVVFASSFKNFVYRLLRRFHAPSSAVMVATQSIMDILKAKKFSRLVLWSRGVDTDLYHLWPKTFAPYASFQRPILLYVGRVSVEKNLEAFLQAQVPGTKVVVGDGPDLKALMQKYPKTMFLGVQEGDDLARHYAAADLFVFPSKTDTFGLVLLEAMACGLRVASYPSPGPIDILSDEHALKFSCLDQSIDVAINKALKLSDLPHDARDYASRYSWQICTDQFYTHLQASTPYAVGRIIRMAVWLKQNLERTLSLSVK